MGDDLKTSRLVRQFDSAFDGESTDALIPWEQIQWVCDVW